ncbi:MAG: hypothetical protein EXX96DRAFT_477245, partial [Benjaminiella poitrasii]
FWYTVCQLVNNRRPTNSRHLPENFLEVWDEFRRQYPQALYQTRLVSGASQCLAEACTELSTSYTNAIVEHFEKKLIYYLKYRLQNMFVTIERKVINDIAEKYCYQLICQGTPEWPNTTNDLNIQDIRQRITNFCLPLKDLLNIRATLVTLSQSPDKTIPLLLFLLAELEQDHRNSTPYDVRRLPLPRLSSVLPSPTYHWRLITISANALNAFLPGQSLPRGYVDQLQLFYTVFKFYKLRFRR